MRRGDQEVPLSACEAEAEHNPTLADMIRRKIPLTRNNWLTLAWGHEKPSGEDWTAEHEAEVPECFRDRHSGHQRDEKKK